MFDDNRSFISRTFLQATLDVEFKAYLTLGRDVALLAKLQAWSERATQTETQDEAAFIHTFFEEIWGFEAAGRASGSNFTIKPKYSVPGASGTGAAGIADLALGNFRGEDGGTPQVLCEFKDIKSNLDAKQNRKGSTNSPVEQCLNYVRFARKDMFGNEAVQPWWGLVTDMNEFRLYWWDRAPREFVKFTIRGRRDLLEPNDLLSDGEESQFDRFLFAKLFNRDTLISHSGRPALLRYVEKQWLKEEEIEEEFYGHYKDVRDRLFNVLTVANPAFSGTLTQLLRVSQKLLDRFIFAFYCEDMGERMLFPPQFIKEHLVGRSKEPYYEIGGTEIWGHFKRLFNLMNTGGKFGETPVPYINGGLFDDDPLIDGLEIPNHIFAAHRQGENEASLAQDRTTLLYLSGRYNYAAKGDAKESLSLYTLGRIFEQSITELEYKVGELEGRDTVAKLSKRKRDGVYYTPENVVNYLVEETLTPWFDRVKADCGYSQDGALPTKVAAEAYLERLRQIRIVDPACGSGAFLISAFRRLLDERKSVAQDIEAGKVDETPLIAEILANNIFGVDINPSSVEIAKLALWLHSARAKAPLSSLDLTIRCGNSLVGTDYWTVHPVTDAARDRVNPFDWDAAFRSDDAPGLFDIVLGNPPYVKLQNLMKVDPDVVVYLQTKREVGTYESTQTGNFDLYLPFIEKGLRLLRKGGRMAYIAPSLWAVNEYGSGLRKVLHRTRQLERWIDFKSHQVFKEAITYTALQFFTCAPNEMVEIAISPAGEMGDVDWNDEALAVPSGSLRGDAEWLMATGQDRELIERLARDCLRLDDKSLTSGITVGIQTSADKIYHLRKQGKNSYECKPKDLPGYVVAIEDGLMKPLVSGSEAQRYEHPVTDTFLLFPYARDARGKMGLMAAADLQAKFPKAWAYLKSYEGELRGREKSQFDDESWYRFGRNQSIEKQDHPKLVVPRLVVDLSCSHDHAGGLHLDNVDVGGVVAAKDANADFLLAVLNSQVANFVFRRISKPFQNGYFSANKQFIAPLPIPHADAATQAVIGALARGLQERWTNRRDLLAEAARRLSVLGRAKHNAQWLWPDLPASEEAHIERLQGHLGTGQLETVFAGGELKLIVNGAVILDRIYLDDAEGKLTEAYWRYLILGKRQTDAKTFAANLRKPPVGDGAAVRQFMEKVQALGVETNAIRRLEEELNEVLFDLYHLSKAERILIENDCAHRPVI